MAKLTVASGELSGREFDLEPGLRFVFGREAADITLPDKRISRRHCLVEVRPEGVYVKDLNSTNGTFLNGEAISEAVLKDGDTLRVGFTDIVYAAGPVKVSSTDDTEDIPSPDGAASAKEAEKRGKFVRSKSRIIAAKYAAMGKDAPSKARQLISAKGRFCEACGEAVSPDEAKEFEGVWLCPMCALIAEKQKEQGGDFLPSYAKIVGGRLPGKDSETLEDAKMMENAELEVEDVPLEEILGAKPEGDEAAQTQLADEGDDEKKDDGAEAEKDQGGAEKKEGE